MDSAPIRRADLAVKPELEQHEEEGEHNIGAATAEGHGPLSTPGDALEQYTDTINDLLDINSEIAPGSDDEGLLKAVAARSPSPGPRTSPTCSAACCRTSSPPAASGAASTAS
jgi:hypothetical protein